MTLNISDGRKIPDYLLRDFDIFRQIPPDKLPILLEFVSTYILERRPVTARLFEDLAKKVKVKDVTLAATIKVLSLIMGRAPTVTKEELIADLQQLKFDKKVIDQILDFLEATKTKAYDYAKRTKDEAIPRLADINWRVDIRHASGDLLKEPTVYALMRIQGYDGEEMSQVYLELDKDGLSWLETILNRIKAKFIEAEKIKEKMYPSDQN